MNNMKTTARSILATAVLAMALTTSAAAQVEITKNDWTASYNETNNELTVKHRGRELFKKIFAETTYRLGNTQGASVVLSSADVKAEAVAVEVNDPDFGAGESLRLVRRKDGVTMTQTLSFFDEHPYFIAQLTLEADNGETVLSNRMIPFAIGDYTTPFSSTAANHILWIPFDNDGHIDYKNFTIKGTEPTEVVSCETSCVYNADDRFGLVAGAVDHDNWKNGVTITGNYMNRVTRFECLSGLSNSDTRDVLPHGSVRGKTVSSARFMIGAFDDWREGMNAFADANALVEPPAEWHGGNPVGWSSWGAQQQYVNYDGVVESARFMKDNLFEHGFYGKDGKITISLDSFGEDNIPATRISNLAKKVFGEGTTYTYEGTTYEGMNMTLGLYGGPFVIWKWAIDGKVPGTGLNGERDYTYGDMLLKVNGQPYQLGSNGGYASDPTHPAMRTHIEYAFKHYSQLGAKYVKIDFMNCGIVQGDSYYNSEITTAVQAYNYGMKIVREEAEKYGLYLVMAMSPAFPYQYVHGRRTCCDRFSQIHESEYVMNALSYGWWFDRLYTVLDPDQLVMCKTNYLGSETDGENRVRATTGMTTGAFIFGDNFSDKVKTENGIPCGEPSESRRRAVAIMGNEDINRYVRENTGAFMPVEGIGEYTTPNTSETIFQRHTDEADYVAVFNFDGITAKNGRLSFERLGIAPSNISAIKELWFGTDITFDSEGFDYSVPKQDVRVYRLSHETSAVKETAEDAQTAPLLSALLTADGNACNIKSSQPIIGMKVYGIDERLLGSFSGSEGLQEISLPIACSPIIAIIDLTFADGTKKVLKATR